MHRIDTPTAEKDKWGDGKNGYTNGDPATGVKSTALNAEIFDSLQEEICNVIEKNGITLNQSKNDQLFAAIKVMIDDSESDLNLGTAATHDVTTSHSDTTAGHVLQVGDGGLLSSIDNRMGQVSQFLAYSSTEMDEVPANGAGWQSAYAPARRAQAFMNTSGHFYSRFSLSDAAFDTITPWAIHYTTLNKPGAADVGAVAKAGDTMTGKLTMNVDGEAIRLQAKTAGAPSYIFSADSANASCWYIGMGSTNNADAVFNSYKGGNNSVVLKADGSVNITPTHNKYANVAGPLSLNGAAPQIIFTETDINKKYILVADGGNIRLDEDSTAGNNVWTWTSSTNVLSVNGQLIPANYGNFDARYYTQSAANAKFATKTQLGTRGSMGVGSGTTEAPAGCVLTGGGDFGASDGSYYYRPMQYVINGTPYTAAYTATLQTNEIEVDSQTDIYKSLPLSNITELTNCKIYNNLKSGAANDAPVICLKDEGGIDFYQARGLLTGNIFIVYEPETGIIRQIDNDAFAIWPINMSVKALDSIPAGCSIDGTWIYSKGEVSRDPEALKAENKRILQRKLRDASTTFFMLQSCSAVDAAEDSDAEQMTLLQQYASALRSVDLTSSQPDWPSVPNILS
ncbi:tail fiber assembly protein [Enterobacter kobei]|uniref:tail fiber assembly protein n=1 Tax=Enterobacter kobei TaxID=208224 RepID=UPI00079505CD|nr:tail fiber assembly protein [Enterobacter kobei]SAF46789.1 phage tail fiber assembly protein [Enterobacter kobei]